MFVGFWVGKGVVGAVGCIVGCKVGHGASKMQAQPHQPLVKY